MSLSLQVTAELKKSGAVGWSWGLVSGRGRIYSRVWFFTPGAEEASGLLALVELGAMLVRSYALSLLRWRCSRLAREAVPSRKLAEVI